MPKAQNPQVFTKLQLQRKIKEESIKLMRGKGDESLLNKYKQQLLKIK